ncbi:RIIB lysis inhibitor [Sinorhizobium phage ort11]|uniref:RIIB lysis inhibitor n=1 Tax=Sinorhizobium phage ort11 TaxID=2599764 RepID=A0A5C2H231_9CAUD|nr:RIIB lysis inhibitor [Sinorhizobium phage ort11]QEP29850.1 rIIB lysis inhibitor [Sinorhizobium phage ort11]
MPELRVVSAIADKNNVVLYLENGDTHTVPQTDYRLKALLDQIIPITARGQVAVVSLEQFSVYEDFTKKTNGFIRFLKVAKSAVKGFFGLDPEEEPTKVTVTVETPAESVKEVSKPTAEEILSQAQEIGAKDEVSEEETIVAVVNTGSKDKPKETVIPGAEALKEQFVHSVKTGNTVGMENFMKRISKMIDKRGHSVEDLLRFMERGDLPVADDGSIIAYKILKRAYNAPEGTYVDCHSGKVFQKIGSYVVVDESLVDKNRRNECSNGLHIARRGYLGSFSGDVCVLCKIAPEDVITVPHGDPNKVRVCGYHILFLIPQESFYKLKNNQPMTSNPEASDMLARAIAGKHVGKLEEVRITGSMGNGLKITPLNPDGSKKQVEEVSTEERKKAKAFDDANSAAASGVDPKAINKQVAQEEAKAEVEKTLSNKDKAGIYFNEMRNEENPLKKRQNYGRDLMVLKGKAKVSYQKLGLPVDTADQLEAILVLKDEPETVETSKPTPQDVQEQQYLFHVEKRDKHGAVASPHKTRAEFIQALYKDMANESLPLLTRQKSAQDLLDIKKKAKLSWEKLGFHFDILQLITMVLALKEEPKPQTKAEPAKQADKPKDGAKGPSRQEQARALYEANDYQAVIELKKKAKVGWDKLGFTEDEVKGITSKS